jgi:hypothetical protein
MITQADVNKFLNEFGINNSLMAKLIKESVDIELKENIKLKQTLTEIKELCEEEEEDWCDYETGEPTDNAIFAKQILEKISEVLNDTSYR